MTNCANAMSAFWANSAVAPNVYRIGFDGKGLTGQTGIYGRLDPATGKMSVWDAPKGIGPYGITATPHDWSVHIATSRTSSDGDGGRQSSPEVLDAVRGAEVVGAVRILADDEVRPMASDGRGHRHARLAGILELAVREAQEVHGVHAEHARGQVGGRRQRLRGRLARIPDGESHAVLALWYHHRQPDPAANGWSWLKTWLSPLIR